MARRATLAVGGDREREALAHLAAAGLTLVHRNFRCRVGEIDLVMLDRDCLVFVEVRYRARNRFTSAATSVDAAKQRKLTRAAALFLAHHPQFSNGPVRFDVVGFDAINENECRLQWIRDAFRPEH